MPPGSAGDLHVPGSRTLGHPEPLNQAGPLDSRDEVWSRGACESVEPQPEMLDSAESLLCCCPRPGALDGETAPDRAGPAKPSEGGHVSPQAGLAGHAQLRTGQRQIRQQVRRVSY